MSPRIKLFLVILALCSGLGLSGGLLGVYGQLAAQTPIDWPVEGEKPGQATISGRFPGSLFGIRIVVGDVNGDGIEELITSATEASETSENNGEVYVIQPPLPMDHTYIRPPQTALLIQGKAGAQLGTYLDSGDMNGDGFDDIAVGSWVDSETFIYLGSERIKADAPLTVTAAAENMAMTVSGSQSGLVLCDFNADGYQDLFLLEYVIDSGLKLWGVLGSQSLTSTQTISLQMPTDANVIIEGFNPKDWGTPAGDHLACGDFDGNHVPDLAIGIPLESPQNRDRAGSVFVIPGDPAITAAELVTITMPGQAGTVLDGIDTYNGPEGGDGLGAALEVADINQDGKDDLLIGAPGGWGVNNWYGFAGEVYLWLGRQLVSGRFIISSQASWTVYGENVYNSLGTSISTGDVDGDAAPEILLGCPSCDQNIEPYTTFGKGYIFEPLEVSGVVPVNQVAQIRFLPYRFSSCLGYEMDSIDIDLDGYREVLISAPCDHYLNGLPGTIYAISYPVRTRIFMPFVGQAAP